MRDRVTGVTYQVRTRLCVVLAPQCVPPYYENTFARGLSSSFFSASLASLFADLTSDLDDKFTGTGLPEVHVAKSKGAPSKTPREQGQVSHKCNLSIPGRISIYIYIYIP